MKYLFPTEKARKFMCNDLCVELLNLLPHSLCFSSQNINAVNRKNNKDTLIKQIIQFFENNLDYVNMYKAIYNCDYEGNVEDVLITYVFYVSNLHNKYRIIDIFRDKRSVCFCPISVIDII